jgi:hypothetical protein
LKVTQTLIDEDENLCITLEPENLEADCECIVTISPLLSFNPALRQYQFNVHQEYAGLDVAFLKTQPAHPIPHNAFRAKKPNPSYLQIHFKSAHVPSEYELLRFKSSTTQLSLIIFQEEPI